MLRNKKSYRILDSSTIKWSKTCIIIHQHTVCLPHLRHHRVGAVLEGCLLLRLRLQGWEVCHLHLLLPQVSERHPLLQEWVHRQALQV